METPTHLEEYKFIKGRIPWNYNRAKLICPECRTFFYVSQSAIHKRKYCSKKCHNDARRLKIDPSTYTHKQCSRCHEKLPLNQFQKHKKTAGGYYNYCKKCHGEKSKEWRMNNPDKVKISNRISKRKNRLCSSNGKIFIGKDINKRPYPTNNLCEICKMDKLLHYHHWNDKDLSKGMWICVKCHSAAHWLENHSPTEYFDLKSSINSP